MEEDVVRLPTTHWVPHLPPTGYPTYHPLDTPPTTHWVPHLPPTGYTTYHTLDTPPTTHWVPHLPPNGYPTYHPLDTPPTTHWVPHLPPTGYSNYHTITDFTTSPQTALTFLVTEETKVPHKSPVVLKSPGAPSEVESAHIIF